MHRKSFCTRSFSLPYLTSAGILGPIRLQKLVKPGGNSKNSVIGKFRYGFNILKVYLKMNNGTA